jgi:hypothetical protein
LAISAFAESAKGRSSRVREPSPSAFESIRRVSLGDGIRRREPTP